MAANTMDLIEGGSMLPHVYCKNIILENGVEEGDIDVTLNFEIMQNKNNFSKSSIVNNLKIDGLSLADFIFLQVVPFQSSNNIKSLRPSYKPDGWQQQRPGQEETRIKNAYLIYGSNSVVSWIQSPSNLSYLPKGPLHSSIVGVSGDSTMGIVGSLSSSPLTLESELHGESGISLPKPQFLGLGSLKAHGQGVPDPGLVREEVIDGKAYYIFPYNYTYTYKPLGLGKNALGFMFYCYLDVPLFYKSAADIPDDGITAESLNLKVLNGPVNTEVVFAESPNEVAETREQFFTYEGERWNGSVHLHMCGINEAPDGYCGPGGLGENQGWMAGKAHVAGAPKLSLNVVSNYKIQDFRFKSTEQFSPNVQGLYPPPTDNQDIIEKIGIEGLISPFQKETKKYLFKVDHPGNVAIASGNKLFLGGFGLVGGGYTAGDNDAEFSKLYISRDKENNARGLFAINFEQLLWSNSPLYRTMSGGSLQNTKLKSTLANSTLLELKIYRDRVKKRPMGNRYENYANDTSYEEPSYLVGTVNQVFPWYGSPSGGQGITMAASSGGLQEVDLHMPNGSNNSERKVRFFTFRDLDVGEKSAGLYQYRIEMKFKDGTYGFLKKLLVDLSKARSEMNKYYDLSLSGHTIEKTLSTAQRVGQKSENPALKKLKYKPYFKNQTFEPEFAQAAAEKFSQAVKPWDAEGTPTHPTLLDRLEFLSQLFDLPAVMSVNWTMQGLVADFFKSMVSPESGSPRGINHLIKLADAAIDHLQVLLGSTKISKVGGGIGSKAATNAYSFGNFFDHDISSSDSMIEEYHSFDHPSELHKALSNENIYIDYLSLGGSIDPAQPLTQASPLPNNPPPAGGFAKKVGGLTKKAYNPNLPSPTSTPPGPPVPAGNNGPYAISKQDYQLRCQMDAWRVSKWGNPEQEALDGNPNITEDNIAGSNAGGGQIGGPMFEFDVLSNSAYSYLMPSIVELSDPAKKDSAFNFKFNAFEPSDGAVGFQPTLNLTHIDYDRVVTALTTYGHNKADVDDADLMPDYYKPSSDDSAPLEREFYKNLFNSNNITVHESAYHDQLFAKKPGAISDKVSDPLLNELLPSWPDDFSDKNIATDSHLKKLFADERNLFISPSGKTRHDGSWNIELPNVYKMAFYSDGGGTTALSENYAEILKETQAGPNPVHNSYFFLHTNLISEIQVYSGQASSMKIWKDDESSWQKLQKSDIESLTSGKTIFCRMVFYDPAATQGFTLPIINKYFLISAGTNPEIASGQTSAPGGGMASFGGGGGAVSNIAGGGGYL